MLTILESSSTCETSTHDGTHQHISGTLCRAHSIERKNESYINACNIFTTDAASGIAFWLETLLGWIFFSRYRISPSGSHKIPLIFDCLRWTFGGWAERFGSKMPALCVQHLAHITHRHTHKRPYVICAAGGATIHFRQQHVCVCSYVDLFADVFARLCTHDGVFLFECCCCAWFLTRSVRTPKYRLDRITGDDDDDNDNDQTCAPPRLLICSYGSCRSGCWRWSSFESESIGSINIGIILVSIIAHGVHENVIRLLLVWCVRLCMWRIRVQRGWQQMRTDALQPNTLYSMYVLCGNLIAKKTLWLWLLLSRWHTPHTHVVFTFYWQFRPKCMSESKWIPAISYTYTHIQLIRPNQHSRTHTQTNEFGRRSNLKTKLECNSSTLYIVCRTNRKEKRSTL